MLHVIDHYYFFFLLVAMYHTIPYCYAEMEDLIVFLTAVLLCISVNQINAQGEVICN